MSGIELIAAERRRQVEEERWTAEHDDEHARGQIARAAAVYALPEGLREMQQRTELSENGGRDLTWEEPRFWPWEPEWYKPTPDNRIRELVKAGALIAAEIDRLQRQGD